MAERLLSEKVSVIATIDPDDYAVSTQKSDVWNMKNFSKVMAIGMRGAPGTNASTQIKLKLSATSNGTFSTLISGKISTARTSSGHDDYQDIINLSAAEAAATTCEWCLVHLTVATSKSDYAVVVLGEPVRTEAYTTIAANDLSTVGDIIA